MDIRNFKDNTKAAAAYLAEQGVEVSHTRLLEALSRAFGERNWSTLHAQLGKLKNSPAADEPEATTAPEWDPSQGPMSEDQYVRYGGNRCPFCGSDELEAGNVEADGTIAWDKTDCLVCSSSWSSSFNLMGYFNANKGDDVPEAPSALAPDDTAVKFDEPSARENATTMAGSDYGLDVIECFRNDIVDDIVEDVRTRARKHGFSFRGARRAQELARESADVLNLDASETEIFEAAQRLA